MAEHCAFVRVTFLKIENPLPKCIYKCTYLVIYFLPSFFKATFLYFGSDSNL